MTAGSPFPRKTTPEHPISNIGGGCRRYRYPVQNRLCSSMVISSELRHRQCIDAVILRMGADELHEGDLPTEIESGHQLIVSSRDLEPHTPAVQHFGLRSGFLNLICGCPLRRLHELMPALQRDLCFRVPASEVDKRHGGVVDAYER
jgi:hypothetical protein